MGSSQESCESQSRMMESWPPCFGAWPIGFHRPHLCLVRLVNVGCVSGKGEAAKGIGFETRTVGFHRQQLRAVPVAPMARDCFVVAARSHGGAVGSKWCDRCGSADVEVVRFRSGSMCAPACRSANQARSWPRGTDRARPKTRHRSPRHNVIVRATTSRSANQARSWPRGTVQSWQNI